MILVNLDVMLAKRKMRSKELAETIDITEANLSLLKSGKVKGVRYNGPDLFVLDQSTWSPVNTQNTSVVREVIPAFIFVTMACPVPEPLRALGLRVNPPSLQKTSSIIALAPGQAGVLSYICLALETTYGSPSMPSARISSGRR